jgi:8-oxo-dGTP pyrophosphatase MutT (NUDIX family)
MNAMTSAAPRITNPELIPVAGVDDHLPPLPAERLQPQTLRQRFAAPLRWQPEIPGDGARFDPQGPTARASVLVPLVMREGGLQVLLTRRTAHLRSHAGQISFPGGKAEAHDADAVATALRETEEEVGLARRHVEVIGSLPVYATVTGFVVTPVVGLVAPDFDLQIDSGEVDEAFEVPLPFLMTPAHHRRHRWEAVPGVTRQFLSMPWQGGAGQQYFIWGATAAMLRNLYGFLAQP